MPTRVHACCTAAARGTESKSLETERMQCGRAQPRRETVVTYKFACACATSCAQLAKRWELASLAHWGISHVWGTRGQLDPSADSSTKSDRATRVNLLPRLRGQWYGGWHSPSHLACASSAHVDRPWQPSLSNCKRISSESSVLALASLGLADPMCLDALDDSVEKRRNHLLAKCWHEPATHRANHFVEPREGLWPAAACRTLLRFASPRCL